MKEGFRRGFSVPSDYDSRPSLFSFETKRVLWRRFYLHVQTDSCDSQAGVPALLTVFAKTIQFDGGTRKAEQESIIQAL